jgi:hypothetical protein
MTPDAPPRTIRAGFAALALALPRRCPWYLDGSGRRRSREPSVTRAPGVASRRPRRHRVKRLQPAKLLQIRSTSLVYLARPDQRRIQAAASSWSVS